MRIESRWRWAPGLVLAWLAAVGAAAGQMIPMDVPGLTARADVIVHAQAVSATCLRDERGRLVTRVEVEVRDVWKGRVPGERFTIVLAGGTLGNRRVTVPGQAQYVPGEEFVGFLRWNERGEGVTVGLSQGKFAVSRDLADGDVRVWNPFLGVPAGLGGEAGGSLTAKRSGQLTLGDLHRQVEASRP
ncbi:MAG TPA: hypothetical protein PKM73_02605 [Verrucomicrobiota bacterium]|nr:hypothetical protein [Verrucomicrobiota bacterium]HNU49685.1 hypothetical protein [Verrucomicrobiota bacterium]